MYQLAPWGEERADYRTALLATALETLARTDPTWTLQDFLPFILDQNGDDIPDPHAQPPELQEQIWRTIAARFQQ